MSCKQLRYLYFTSKEHHNHKSIDMNNLRSVGSIYQKDQINASKSRIPKVLQATEEYDPIFDNENLLTLFDDIILSRSLDIDSKNYDKLPIQHGQEILENMLTTDEHLNNFESVVF